jgi:hypothetical protein
MRAFAHIAKENPGNAVTRAGAKCHHQVVGHGINTYLVGLAQAVC